MKLACESLDRSLREIIAASDTAGWSEKLLLTRVWLATCDLDGDNAVRTLRNSIDSFSEIIGDGVSKTGSHAAQAVWRASSLRTVTHWYSYYGSAPRKSSHVVDIRPQSNGVA